MLLSKITKKISHREHEENFVIFILKLIVSITTIIIIIDIKVNSNSRNDCGAYNENQILVRVTSDIPKMNFSPHESYLKYNVCGKYGNT